MTDEIYERVIERISDEALEIELNLLRQMLDRNRKQIDAREQENKAILEHMSIVRRRQLRKAVYREVYNRGRANFETLTGIKQDTFGGNL